MIGRVKVRGQLRHCFWGDYSAAVALDCGTPEAARDVLATLGAPWKLGKDTPRVLIGVFDRAALELEKARLARYGADARKIDSCRFSVDYGEMFECVIDVTPAEQASLWEAAP